MCTLPNIDKMRLTTLHKREVKEQEEEAFHKGLKAKILACATKAIQNGANQGKYNATVGYYNLDMTGTDFVDGYFTPKEHGLTNNTKETSVRPIWQECVDELKRNGYDASLDINTYKNTGINMLPGEHKGFYIKISWDFE